MAPPLIVAPLLPLTLGYWLAARARFHRPQQERCCAAPLLARAAGGVGWPSTALPGHVCLLLPGTLLRANHPCPMLYLHCLQTLALADAIRLDRGERRGGAAGRAGPGAGAQGRRAQASQVCGCWFA